MRAASRLAEPTVSRLCRGLSLLVFVGLFAGVPAAVASVAVALGLDNLFLRLDPLVALTVPLAARAFVPGLVGGLVMLALAARFGRVFCRYLCPMGTTLSLVSTCLKPLRPVHPVHPVRLVSPRFRYLVLAATVAAALVGGNLAFWVSPIPLVTRLYALVLAPFGMETAITLSEALTIPGLDLAALVVPVYDGSLFVWLFFAVLAVLEVLSPGCWCNGLCPAGAAQSLVNWRRFRRGPSNSVAAPAKLSRTGLPLPSRRAFVVAVMAGTGLAVAQRVCSTLQPLTAAGSPDAWLRPPGALPEMAFLASCTRCGLCLHVCPSNALQAQGLEGGLAGMFSPVFVPARGGCDPACTRCGAVCPTGAIAPLAVQEKQQAKLGTAVVRRADCLVWKDGASCLVCQEVCPFGALLMEPLGNGLFAPTVIAARCYGCGYCERHCPATTKAIVISGTGALRLEAGASEGYAGAANRAGLDLRLGHAPPIVPGTSGTEGAGDDALPPGFSL